MKKFIINLCLLSSLFSLSSCSNYKKTTQEDAQTILKNNLKKDYPYNVVKITYKVEDYNYKEKNKKDALRKYNEDLVRNMLLGTKKVGDLSTSNSIALLFAYSNLVFANKAIYSFSKHKELVCINELVESSVTQNGYTIKNSFSKNYYFNEYGYQIKVEEYKYFEASINKRTYVKGSSYEYAAFEYSKL